MDLGPDEAKTIPYDPEILAATPRGRSAADNIYYGASLDALVKLGREKGYRLVGCHHWGFNAFLVQDGIGEQWLPEVSPEVCFDTPAMRSRWDPSFIRAHQGSRVDHRLGSRSQLRRYRDPWRLPLMGGLA